MDRRLFLALTGAVFATPRQLWAAPPANLPLPSLRRLKLTNAHTGETFEGTYRNDAGPIPTVMDELSVFLRDHHSGERMPIDVGVIDFLACVMESAGQPGATVLSAYRTPETNAMLARTTFGVADNSQHLYGRAIDVYLPARIQDAMQAARNMKRGGVGWYPQSHFIHLDCGPVRNWTLDGRGFDHMVVDLRQLISGLKISPKGELMAGGAHRPLSVRQRLAFHRMIAKAEFMATRR
jgi:uncharacterized protein YcbK (DUF882 family)